MAEAEADETFHTLRMYARHTRAETQRLLDARRDRDAVEEAARRRARSAQPKSASVDLVVANLDTVLRSHPPTPSGLRQAAAAVRR